MPRFLSENARFLRDNGRWLAGGFLLLFFSSFGQTYVIALSGAALRARFALSNGQFGGLYMLATLASAITLPWLGRSLDVMRGWRVARFSVPCLAGACALLAAAPNVLVLGVALYLLRLFGQGMMVEIAFTEVGRWFVANRGRAMGVVVLGQQTGAALLPVVFVLAQQATGWRMPWILAAALLLLVACPVVVALTRVERVPRTVECTAQVRRTARDWTRRQVLRDPVLYLLLAGTLAPPFIGTTVYFHQSVLVAERGYEPLAFVASFPLMAVTTVIAGLACGHLVDRCGALRVLPFFLLPLAVAASALALVAPVWGVYLFMLLLGLSNGFTQTLLGALWPEVYGLGNLGGIRALIVSAMVMSTALGPGITGALLDLGVSLPTQLLGMALWCVLASFALAAAARAVLAREAMSGAEADERVPVSG